MLLKRGLLYICLFFLVDHSFGQINANILFDQLFIPGGLAKNPIRDITQGPFGLMWFITNDGVHKYDGYQFETFDMDRQSLESVNYTSLEFLNDSILLVGTGNAGLNKFNRNNNTFKRIESDSNKIAIKGILRDKDGKVWIHSDDNGIFLLQKDTLKPVITDTVHTVSISPTGELQYAKGNILFELQGGEEVVLKKLPENHRITSIGYNGSNIWLGTAKNGLYEFGTMGLTKILNKGSKINAILQDKTLNMWVLTHKNGIKFYSKGSFISLRRDFHNQNTLSSDRALTIYQDQNQVIWIGTSAGINKYDPFKTKFELYQYSPFNNNSISSNLVRGIREDSNDNLWVATGDGTVNMLNKQKTHFKRFKIKLPGFSTIIPYDFYEINKKEMLVATSAGMFLIAKNFSYLKPHKTITHRALKGKRARSIIPYDDENLLILSQGRIYHYNITEDILRLIQLKLNKPQLPNQSVTEFARTIYVDQQKNIWIGSYGTVAKINLEESSANYYNFTKNRGPLIMFLERIGQHLWVGTFNGGLLKLDLEDGSYKNYTTKDGLPNDAIYAAIPDTQGNLWLSTNQGISRFSIADESIKNFSISDGLQGMEFNRLAFCKRKNGEIALGGINGLNNFNPKLIKNNPNFPISIILNAEVLNKFEGNKENLHPKISLIGKKELTLPHEQNFLRFNFCTNHFSQPSENKFYYQLENFDDNWVYAENKNSATYTGLKHGSYTFKVRSENPDGLGELQYASIKINISAPFWMKWWFYAGLAFVTGFIGYISINRRMAQNKAVKILLEQEIDRRTKELKKSKDELSDLNQKKDFIFSILSHDLRSPLTTLEGFLGLLINNYEHMKKDEIRTHASVIKTSVGKSLDLIDNTLYWSISQLGNINFTPVKVKVGDLFDKVSGLYGLTARQKHIKLTFKNPKNLNIYADENMAYIIVRNLISNAIKFTPPKKKVAVNAYKEDDMVAITVEDEGDGIETEFIDQLFDQKPNISKRGTSNEKGAGIGLILCKKFIDMHDGYITANNTSKGASFTVKFQEAP